MNSKRFPWLYFLVLSITATVVSHSAMADTKEAGKKQKTEKQAEKEEKEPASSSDVVAPKPPAPKTVKIPGVFEAVQSTEISVDNEHLTALEIERIVPHGTAVRKGQPMIWFKTEDLDKKVKDAETSLKLAKLTMASDEFAHKQFLKTNQMDKAAAKRTRDHARADYDHFVKTELERQILSAEQSLKSSEFSVESSKEELDQLKQMYEEDDLTEESEEIVLRRAKQSYESALFRLEDAKIRKNRSVNVTIPRSEVSRKEALDRAIMTYDKAMLDLDTARQKQEIEIVGKREKFKEKEDDFAELRAERSAVVVKAPHEGIVLYGQLTRGRLPAKPVVLKKDSKVAAKQVIATLVNPSKISIRVDIPEEHVALITAGKKATVTAKAFPDNKLKGSVKKVESIAFMPGKYDCIVNIVGRHSNQILPTMSCELEFAAEKGDADKKGNGKSKAKASK